MKRLLFLLLPLLPLVGLSQTDGYFNMSNTQQPPRGSSLNNTNSWVAFVTTFGTPSTSQHGTISGFTLSANVILTAGAGMEVSLDNSAFAGTKTITQVAGVLPGQPIDYWYRIAGSTAIGGPTSSPLVISSTGATPISVAATYTVNAVPSLSAAPNTITGLNSVTGSPGASQSTIATWANIIGNVTYTGFANVEISLDNSTFVTTPLIFNTGSPRTVWVRAAASAPVGAISGNLVFSASGVSNFPVGVTGTVSSTGANDSIQVKFTDSTSSTGITGALALANWNDWSIPSIASPGGLSKQMKYANGTTSPVQLRFSANFPLFIDNGTPYITSTASGVPTAAWRLCTFLGSGQFGPDTLVITGLPAHTNGWTFRIGSSKITTGTVRQVTWTELVSGTTHTVTAVNTTNNETVVDFANHVFTPAGGVLKFVITDNTGYWFANWIQMVGHN